MKFIIFLPLFLALLELIPGISTAGKLIDNILIADFSIIVIKQETRLNLIPYYSRMQNEWWK